MYKRIILYLELASLVIGFLLSLAQEWYLAILSVAVAVILKILEYSKFAERIDPRKERSVRAAYIENLRKKIEKERENKDIGIYIPPSLKIREKRSQIEKELGFTQDNDRENRETPYIYKTINIKDLVQIQQKDNKGFSIVADSGMGKTMLLEEIALNIADKDNKTNQIPVLFHFSELLHITNSGDIKKKIADKFLPTKAEKYIENWFDKKQILFLIDGLDQVVGDDTNFLKNILDGTILGGNRVIFTTRAFAYSMFEGNLSLSDNYQYIEIEVFNAKQIRAYLQEDYQEISQILSFKQQLLSIPILLSHIKVLHQGHRLKHVKVRADLYREIINKMFEHEKNRATALIKKYSKKDLEHFFKKLSYHTLSYGNINRFSRSISDDLLQNIGLSREDFNSLLQVGIVQEIVEGDSEEIIYCHQSFQEYFASLELKEKILTDSGINRDAIVNHLEYMY